MQHLGITRTRALALALALSTVLALTGSGAAVSASASEHAGGAAAPVSAAPPASVDDPDADGVFDRPGLLSAVKLARSAKVPVEDLSARTTSTTTVLNPDGTSTLQDYGSPVRVHEADGTWTDIDFDLIKRADGNYAPKASGTQTVVGGGGSRVAAEVTFGDGSALSVTWPEVLPVPQVAGGVATYRVNDTSDLVVTVVEGGVSTNIRFNEKPTAANRRLVLGLRTDGVKIAETPQGGLRATDVHGKALASSPTLVAWDAEVDQAGDPAEVVPVDSNLRPVKGSGFHQNQELGLAVPVGFLDDRSTVYPVTVDPSVINATEVRDTWVQNGVAGSNGGSAELRVGAAPTTTTNPAVSYLQFDSTAVAGKAIVGAQLNLMQYYGASCSNAEMLAQPVSDVAWADTITWGTRPAAIASSGVDATVLSNRGATGCPGAWISVDVKNMVAAWAAGTYTDRGFRLSVRSTFQTQPAYERRFCSMNPNAGHAFCTTVATKPYLSITYSTPPPAPSDVEVAPCDSPCTDPITVSSTQPTFSAVTSDVDGDPVTLRLQVRAPSTEENLVDISNADAPVGGRQSIQVPSDVLATQSSFEYRLGAADASSLGEPTWTDWVSFQTPLDLAPTAPTGVEITPCSTSCSAPVVVEDRRPSFTATSTDSDTQMIRYQLQVRHVGLTAVIADVTSAATPQGGTGTVRLGNGVLSTGTNSLGQLTSGGGASTGAWSAAPTTTRGTLRMESRQPITTPTTTAPAMEPDASRDHTFQGSISRDVRRRFDTAGLRAAPSE